MLHTDIIHSLTDYIYLFLIIDFLVTCYVFYLLDYYNFSVDSGRAARADYD